MLSCYAAERNKGVILEVLKPRIETLRGELESRECIHLLEIASGTGEHCNQFISNIPYLKYQPTEIETDKHESIRAWSEHGEKAESSSAFDPFPLDVTAFSDYTMLPTEFQNKNVDVMVCINMIHISPIACTNALFELANNILQLQGFLLTYGPYRIGGFMVESNVRFDESLKARNPDWGVRDLELVESLANNNGFKLSECIEMPSNNCCLVFKRE